MNRRLSIPLALVAIFALTGSASAAPEGGLRTSVIYSSLVSSPLHGDIPSVGAEAYAVNEFGNAVTFSASKNRSLSSVVVTMSSWGCQSGNWTSGDCLTTNGATFSVPITFNLYAADGVTKIAWATQTFAIPYRPSASPTCAVDYPGEWYDNALNACFNEVATNITFDTFTYAGDVAVALPDNVVFGITYNTSGHGYSPFGYANACNATEAGCPYDSLNIALSQDPTDVSVGTDTFVGTVWQNTSYGYNYCDGGAAGTGFFRLDSPGVASCWGAGDGAPTTSPFYVPAVQINAAG
ncbi:MAG TPA: hypothetical protein VIK38_03430 [Coriobacteriia bacterium]